MNTYVANKGRINQRRDRISGQSQRRRQCNRQNLQRQFIELNPISAKKKKSQTYKALNDMELRTYS